MTDQYTENDSLEWIDAMEIGIVLSDYDNNELESDCEFQP